MMSRSTSLPSSTVNSTVQAKEGESESSCRSCLYTGVGTCIGLSAYFFHLAFDDTGNNHGNGSNASHGTKQSSSLRKQNIVPSNHKMTISSARSRVTDVQSTSMKLLRKKSLPNPSNRPFLLVCSACWAAAGAYRLYLD